jgi:predicted aspartyl protease
MKIRKNATAIILTPLIRGRKGICRIEMLLDTGATFTMIPWDIAEKLGYDPARSRKRIHLLTVSTSEVVPLITVEAIELYGHKVRNVEVACHDLPPASRVEGLLGLNFLRNFNIDLHFKRNLLEFRE